MRPAIAIVCPSGNQIQTTTSVSFFKPSNHSYHIENQHLFFNAACNWCSNVTTLLQPSPFDVIIATQGITASTVSFLFDAIHSQSEKTYSRSESMYVLHRDVKTQKTAIYRFWRRERPRTKIRAGYYLTCREIGHAQQTLCVCHRCILRGAKIQCTWVLRASQSPKTT